jgi:hypothetical protein
MFTVIQRFLEIQVEWKIARSMEICIHQPPHLYYRPENAVILRSFWLLHLQRAVINRRTLKDLARSASSGQEVVSPE